MASKLMTLLDPFGIARSLGSEVDRLIEGALVLPAGWLANGKRSKAILPLDVQAEGDNLIVKAAMPGLKPEEVKVEVDGRVLTILGESKLEQESIEPTHHLQDHFYVRLERSVVLPAQVYADKAEAVFAKGVLTVTLPKTGETEIGQIAIKPAEKDQTVAVETVEVQTVAAETTEAQPVPAQTVAAQTATAETAEAQTVAAETAPTQVVAAQKVEHRKARRPKREAAKVEAEKIA